MIEKIIIKEKKNVRAILSRRRAVTRSQQTVAGLKLILLP